MRITRHFEQRCEHQRGILTILDDHYGQRSTIVKRQIPVDNWHELIWLSNPGRRILDHLGFWISQPPAASLKVR